MRINHNIAALNTYRQLSANNANSSKSLEKLSAGLRINRAGDDAAGLAISEKMRGQIRGLEQASRNAQDGISMIQTAEGALNESHSILQRMRELAVQASNDTNTSDDRAEIQNEINQLSSEVNRIGNTTEFNTKSLLNGQSGANATLASTGDDILTGASVTGAVDSSIDSSGKVYTINVSADAEAEVESSRDLKEVGTTNTDNVTLGDSYVAKSIVSVTLTNGGATNVNDINDVEFSDDGGAAASVTHSVYNDINAFNTAADGLGADEAAVFVDGTDTALVAFGTDGDNVGDALNIITNVYDGDALEITTATMADEAVLGTSFTSGTIQISDGTNTAIVSVASTDTVEEFITDVNTALETNNVNATLSYNSTNEELDFTATEVGTANELTITESFSGASLGISSTANDGSNAAEDLVYTVTDYETGTEVADVTHDDGRYVDASSSGITGVALTFAGEIGSKNLTVTNGSLTMQIGSNAGQQFTTNFSDMRSVALEVSSSVASTTITTSDGQTASFTSTANVDNDGSTSEYALDVSTADKATAAVSAIDDAISAVSTERSKLGSYQNRLEHTIVNLGTSAENLTAAESRIRDVDMANEMMVFTKNSILTQAAQAMLAQANQQPQGILQLLR
jgi:flagellin